MKWKSCYVIPCFLESNPIWHRPIKLTLPVIWSLPISWLGLLSRDPVCNSVIQPHASPEGITLLISVTGMHFSRSCRLASSQGSISLLQCYFLRDLPWPIYVSTSTHFQSPKPCYSLYSIDHYLNVLFIYYLLYWIWWDTKVNVHIYY